MASYYCKTNKNQNTLQPDFWALNTSDSEWLGILNSPTSHSCKCGNCLTWNVKADYMILAAPINQLDICPCQPTQCPLASALWGLAMYRRPPNDQHSQSQILSTSREATSPSQDTNRPMMVAFSRKLWQTILSISTWNFYGPRKQPEQWLVALSNC